MIRFLKAIAGFLLAGMGVVIIVLNAIHVLSGGESLSPGALLIAGALAGVGAFMLADALEF